MHKIDGKRRGLREAIAEMAKPHIAASVRDAMELLVKSEKLQRGCIAIPALRSV
jgi:hypothetical protein